MDLERLLEEAKEKRKARYEDISKAKTNQELDEIELDLRKMDFDIKDIEEKINKDDPATRSINDDIPHGKFNPLATYRKNINSDDNKEDNKKDNRKIDVNIDDVALRSKESILERMDIPKEERGLDIGKYIKGMVTGDWKGAETEKRAVLTSGTGVIIPQSLSGQIIDMARNQSLFTLAEVPVIPMESDNLTIGRIKKDPTIQFKKEGEEAPESGFELEAVKLKAKTCYGYAYVSLEAIRSSKNLTTIITNAFSSAIAEAIDQGMLNGQYNKTESKFEDFAPSGIMNDKYINTVDGTGVNGYDAIVKAIGKVRRNNGIASAYGINANTEEALSLLKDSNGQYLEPPKAVTNLNQIVTNQLKNDSLNGDEALVFDPRAMAIGIENNITIQMFNNTDECIKKGLVAFRVYAMLDCVVTQPQHICKIENMNKAS